MPVGGSSVADDACDWSSLRCPITPGMFNDWDVVENMPGAKPGANPAQKAFFEARSIKVFEFKSFMICLDFSR
jgi:hypothetical protein